MARQVNPFIISGYSNLARNITSAAFIRKYHLPSASTVQAAVKGLLEKDFITLEQGVYTVYDIFLGYWIQRQ